MFMLPKMKKGIISKEEFIKNYILKEDEYIDTETGFAFCKNCKTSRVIYLPGVVELGDDKGDFITECKCDCLQEKYEKQKQLIEKSENVAKYIQLRNKSGLAEKYKDIDFNNIDSEKKIDLERPSDFTNARNRFIKFVEKWEQIKRLGQGIYIFGNNGTGKSMLVSCIANEILKKHDKVIMTTGSNIVSRIYSTYRYSATETERDVIEELANVSLLIIDDFGAQQFVKNGEDTKVQEKIFEIINSRYQDKKSTIFTSNYSMQELIEQRGIEKRTIERVAEMSTAVIKLSGNGYRQEVVKQISPLF